MRETLGMNDVIGMTFVMGCAVILGFSNSNTLATYSAISPDEITHPFVPISFAILSSFAFGLRSVTVKFYVSKGYDVYNFAVQHSAVDGLMGSIFFIFWL